MIGILGDVVFEVSSNKVLTLKGLKRTASSKWSEQAVLSRKPISQFISKNLGQVTFTIVLNYNLGIDPREQLDKLRNMAESDRAYACLIGGKPISSSLYQYIVSYNDTWDIISNEGLLLSTTVNISLKDYE